MFDHNDAVGTGGNGCSGHDLDGFACGKRRAFPYIACLQLANDAKRSCGAEVWIYVSGAAGKSVARGAWKWRLVAVGENGFGQDAMEGSE